MYRKNFIKILTLFYFAISFVYISNAQSCKACLDNLAPNTPQIEKDAACSDACGGITGATGNSGDKVIRSPIPGVTNIVEIWNKNGDGFITFGAVIGLLISAIIASITRVYSGGNPDKEKKSMMIATSAVIGFGIVVFARVFVLIIQGVFGVKF